MNAEKENEENGYSVQKKLDQVRKANPAAIKNAIEKLHELNQLIKPLLNRPNKTEEELEMLATINQRLEPLMEQLDHSVLVLGEGLFRQSEKYYNHVKQLAENGDEKALQLYEELKPRYQQALNDWLALDDK